MTPDVQRTFDNYAKKYPNNKLYTNYRLALSIAHKFATSPYTNSDDLEQEALIALNECIATYNEKGGKTFASYATTNITNRLKQFVCTTGSIVRPEFNSGYTKIKHQNIMFMGDNNCSIEHEISDNDANRRAFDNVREFFYCLSEYEISLLERFIDGYIWKEIAAMDGKSVSYISNKVKQIAIKLKTEIDNERKANHKKGSWKTRKQRRNHKHNNRRIQQRYELSRTSSWKRGKQIYPHYTSGSSKGQFLQQVEKYRIFLRQILDIGHLRKTKSAYRPSH